MIVIIPFIFIILADQITKNLIRDLMVVGQSNSVFGDIVRLTYVENPGIAFGIRIPNSWIFTILSILAVIGIVVYLIKQWNESRWIKFSLSLILGGAVGNLIDRILFSKVVDFVDVGVGQLRWPVFNVADSAVVVGMFILFIAMYNEEKKHSVNDTVTAGEQSGS